MQIETETMNTAEPVDTQLHPMCSLLNKPFPECYCMHMSSYNIPKIIEFCAGEFSLCPIYMHNTRLSTPWKALQAPDCSTIRSCRSVR